MSQDEEFDRRLARAFRGSATHTFTARNTLNRTEFAVSEVRCDNATNEFTAPIGREDAFLLMFQVRNWDKRLLWRDGTAIDAVPLKAGAMSIFDLRASWIGYGVSAFHHISFHLPIRSLEILAEIEGLPSIQEFDNNPGHGADDPTVRNLALTLLPAFANPREANTLFVDSMTVATVAHLLRAHGTRSVGGLVTPLRLTPMQEARAKEMLVANLDGELTIRELAGECGMSVTAFSNAFKRSVGIPPHRWLLERRVARALTLLRTSSMTLDEIASACGFADAQHLTRIFAQTVKATPAEFKASIRH